VVRAAVERCIGTSVRRQVCRGDRFAQEDFRGRLRGLVGDITLDWRYTRTGLALSQGQAVEVAK